MAIWHLMILKGFLAFAFILMFSGGADGCSCMPQHPQEKFCNAEYVVRARVIRKHAISGQHHDTYKIKIYEPYLMTKKAKYELKFGRILTAKADSMCGVTLNPGKVYVIAAKGPVLRVCDYFKEVDSMTLTEKRGFKGVYRKGCGCKVTTCFGGNCPENRSSCSWSPFMRCETQHSLCVSSRSHHAKDQYTKCHWRWTPAYRQCIHNP